jgi:hypothetical protein
MGSGWLPWLPVEGRERRVLVDDPHGMDLVEELEVGVALLSQACQHLGVRQAVVDKEHSQEPSSDHVLRDLALLRACVSEVEAGHLCDDLGSPVDDVDVLLLTGFWHALSVVSASGVKLGLFFVTKEGKELRWLLMLTAPGRGLSARLIVSAW